MQRFAGLNSIEGWNLTLQLSKAEHDVTGRFLYIDRTFKKTYTKCSNRSVETCEAYRRGRACRLLPLFL